MNLQNKINNFFTKYGLISLLKNERFISYDFKHGGYWDEKTLNELKQYINPNKNIIEIGAHCGTSTLVYSTFLNENSKIYAFEPQKIQFELLKHNVKQNNLQNKIICYNNAVFCYNGIGYMNDVDLDGCGGNIKECYDDVKRLCNFGGTCLGNKGEKVNFIELDTLNLDNIGYMHIDAQGAENYILSKSIEIIKNNRPVIFFENNFLYDKKMYDTVKESYPQFEKESLFNIVDFCMNELKYSKYVRQFHGSNDDLLLP
jgi:FkbM family methyltransferase